MSEDEIVSLERTANVLRGMALDTRVPPDVRGLLAEHAVGLDRIAARHLPPAQRAEGAFI